MLCMCLATLAAKVTSLHAVIQAPKPKAAAKPAPKAAAAVEEDSSEEESDDEDDEDDEKPAAKVSKNHPISCPVGLRVHFMIVSMRT